MNKQEIYAFLQARGLWFEVTEHRPLFRMDEPYEVEVPFPGSDAKNLFVRDNKKRNYYVLTFHGSRKIDLKEFRARYGLRPLSLASEGDLRDMLGLTPGAVGPFGLLNDGTHKVELFLDGQLLEDPGVIGLHPNDNTATVWMKTADLIGLLRAHGSTVRVEEF